MLYVTFLHKNKTGIYRNDIKLSKYHSTLLREEFKKILSSCIALFVMGINISVQVSRFNYLIFALVNHLEKGIDITDIDIMHYLLG